MKAYKVAVFCNRVKVPYKEHFALATRYFQEKTNNKVTVEFEFFESDIDFDLKIYQAIIDGRTTYGVDEDVVKEKIRSMNVLEPIKYHACIFLWNKEEKTITNGLVTSWSNYGQIIPDTEFIQIVTSEDDHRSYWIYKSIVHELIHSFFKRIARTGLVLNDPMDEMYVLGNDGTIRLEKYYKNHDPEAPDGNHATALRIIGPYWDRVFKNPIYESIQQIMYSKNRVRELFLPLGTRRSGQKLKEVRYIVCHDTGNPGTTALQNVTHYIATANGSVQASAHEFVDHIEVIQCIPHNEKAFHVRYDTGKDPNIPGNYANDYALGIEMCYGKDIPKDQAYKNYVQRIAELCRMYKLDPFISVRSHAELDPERRTDPYDGLKHNGKDWMDFIVDISLELDPPTKNLPKSIYKIFFTWLMDMVELIRTKQK